MELTKSNAHLGGLFALYLMSGIPSFLSGPVGYQVDCDDDEAVDEPPP